MLNDQKDKLSNNPEVSNRTNQFQTQVVIERVQPVDRTDRTGRPVVGTNTRTVQDGRKSRSQEIDTCFFTKKLSKPIERSNPLLKRVEPKHVHLMTARVSTLKWHVIERGNPLLKQTENVPDGCQTRSCHESISFNIGDETIRDRTGQPVVNHDESSHEQTMLNEVNMDFRIPGLPHSVVKQAESSLVRELVKKIENHPDRHALQLDLQQNKAYNPFSATSKKMIKNVGNVELFELFETDPKTQCKACLSYWIEGIVYCTCGYLFKVIVANRSFIVYTLDLLSIPEHVIKKGRPHGHRYGKAPENKEYLAHTLKKRCIKRKFTGTHDRFLRDHVFLERMLENNRDEDVCRKWDDLAEQDHTYRMSEEEYFHYRQNWWISLNKSGNTTEPMRKRSDFNQALSTLNRVHREAGGKPLKFTPCWKCQPPGGNGVNPGGLPKNSKKVIQRGCMQRFTIERGNPLFTDLWRKPQTDGFHEFILFVTDRSFTADSDLL